MARWIVAIAVFFLTSCGKSDEEVRSIVRNELATTMHRSYVTDAKTIGPYSPAVQAGNFLFVSGQLGLNPETAQLVGDDIESQTRQAMSNLLSLLGKAGFDSSHVIQCSVFLKDINDFPKMNLIYGGYFTDGQYPTRATVEVSNLPRNAKIEIAAVAYKP
jgi:2-iminobutanoate/2-iminopropanoate deaminase